MQKDPQTISDKQMTDLANAYASRDIAKALKILASLVHLIQKPTVCLRNAVRLFGYAAWAIDFAPSYLLVVEAVLSKFRRLPLSHLNFCEAAHLSIAEGLVEFHHENYDKATKHFESAVNDATRAQCVELGAVSEYFLGRSLWKQNRYPLALEHLRRAKAIDIAAGRLKRVAAIELVEGWILFRQGDHRTARRLLKNAEAELKGTTAYADLGNAASFMAQICRESGEYKKSLLYFFKAVEYFKKGASSHRNLARTRKNISFVYRLLAREAYEQDRSRQTRNASEKEARELRYKAYLFAREALKTCHQSPDLHRHIKGQIYTTIALLKYDVPKFDAALAFACKAYSLGKEIDDYLLMGDARTIQAAILLDRDQGDDARQSFEFAGEAYELALKTGNRRLMIRALLRKGQALSQHPFNDLKAAQWCLENARALLTAEDRDYVRQSFINLEEKISSICSASTSIRVDIDGRDLNQITGECAEDAIRLFFSNHKKNIIQTARALHTSTRRVREAITIYSLTEESLKGLESDRLPKAVLKELRTIVNQRIVGLSHFEGLLKSTLQYDTAEKYRASILRHVVTLRSELNQNELHLTGSSA